MMRPALLVVGCSLVAASARRASSRTGAADGGLPGRDGGSGAARPLDITADHLTVLSRENRGIWKGHVHAVRAGEPGKPELHIRCDRMVTDYVGENQIDKATCTGNAEAIQGDRIGWGDVAVFDNRKGELVVTGNPHGQQGLNKFKGDKVIFYVDADRVEVENATAHQVGEAPGAKDGGK